MTIFLLPFTIIIFFNMVIYFSGPVLDCLAATRKLFEYTDYSSSSFFHEMKQNHVPSDRKLL